MDHPLTSDCHQDIRKRVVQFVEKSYLIRRQSNIVFVCGGNQPGDMRRLFQAYFDENLSEFEFFKPEFAMKYFFSEADEEPFDLADFEQLVGELSHCIIIFPESAGSFAETGYFSAVPELAKITILVLDSSRGVQDSFILLGPAKKFLTQRFFIQTLRSTITSQTSAKLLRGFDATR